MAEPVNIPAPLAAATERRRSDTPARRRNGALKGGRRRGGRQIHRRADPRQYTEPAGEVTAAVIRLPRKSSKLQAAEARTANRHRWSGRVYQGAREIHG